MESYALPETLYGLIIAEPLQLDVNVDGMFIFITELLRSMFLLLVNYTIQALFLLQFYAINAGKGEEGCASGLESLRVLCVFVFCVSSFLEIRDSENMLFGLWACPTKEPGHSPAHAAGQAHGAVMEAEASNTWNPAARMNVWLKRKTEGTGWTLDNMTKSYKAFAIFVIVLPKLAIALSVAYVGSVYILKSGDAESMILNTLAVLFVVDIDEFIYNTFTPASMKSQLVNIPEISLNPTNMERKWAYFSSTFLHPSLIIGATCWLVQQHDNDCNARR